VPTNAPMQRRKAMARRQMCWDSRCHPVLPRAPEPVDPIQPWLEQSLTVLRKSVTAQAMAERDRALLTQCCSDPSDGIHRYLWLKPCVYSIPPNYLGLTSAWLPAPSHSMVRSEVATSMLGSVMSSMVKAELVVAVLLQSLVAVKVTVAEPVAPHSSDSAVKSLDQVTSPQMSTVALLSWLWGLRAIVVAKFKLCSLLYEQHHI